jgi:hypothetical protein
MLRLNRTLGCLLDAVLIGLTALTLRWPHGFHHYADSEHARGTSGRGVGNVLREWRKGFCQIRTVSINRKRQR